MRKSLLTSVAAVALLGGSGHAIAQDSGVALGSNKYVSIFGGASFPRDLDTDAAYTTNGVVAPNYTVNVDLDTGYVLGVATRYVTF